MDYATCNVKNMVLRGMGDEPVTSAHAQSIPFQQEVGV